MASLGACATYLGKLSLISHLVDHGHICHGRFVAIPCVRQNSVSWEGRWELLQLQGCGINQAHFVTMVTVTILMDPHDHLLLLQLTTSCSDQSEAAGRKPSTPLYTTKTFVPPLLYHAPTWWFRQPASFTPPSSRRTTVFTNYLHAHYGTLYAINTTGNPPFRLVVAGTRPNLRLYKRPFS